MTSHAPHDRWLASGWQTVRTHLPQPPARVVELGCGPLGGFVPALRCEGYDALGIDPKAPDDEVFQRIEFERAELPDTVDAVVASASLHHVQDPAAVIDRIAGLVRRTGVVVVVEWASEQFDEATARWCFDRLGPESEAGWLHHRRAEWLASGLEWSNYVRAWAEREGVHRGDTLVQLLDDRFERRRLAYGPYFFADLAATDESDERAAIDAGLIRACRIEYAGTPR